MDSKAIISESGAASFTAESNRLSADLASHASQGLEAHSDSTLLTGTPYLDSANNIVSPDTFRFRTVKDNGDIIVIDIPVYRLDGQSLTNTVSIPSPPGPPQNSTKPDSSIPAPKTGLSALVTREKLDEFGQSLELLETALRAHVRLVFGKAHAPNAGFHVVSLATYTNSAGILVGDATLRFTLGSHTYYVPARIIT